MYQAAAALQRRHADGFVFSPLSKARTWRIELPIFMASIACVSPRSLRTSRSFAPSKVASIFLTSPHAKHKGWKGLPVRLYSSSLIENVEKNGPTFRSVHQKSYVVECSWILRHCAGTRSGVSFAAHPPLVAAIDGALERT